MCEMKIIKGRNFWFVEFEGMRRFWIFKWWKHFLFYFQRYFIRQWSHTAGISEYLENMWAYQSRSVIFHSLTFRRMMMMMTCLKQVIGAENYDVNTSLYHLHRFSFICNFFVIFLSCSNWKWKATAKYYNRGHNSRTHTGRTQREPFVFILPDFSVEVHSSRESSRLFHIHKTNSLSFSHSSTSSNFMRVFVFTRPASILPFFRTFHTPLLCMLRYVCMII